jgi:hypothetical protein
MIHFQGRKKIVFTRSFSARKCDNAAFTSDLLQHNNKAAKELLADGRGVFVPLGDAQQMAEEINKLLSDELLIDRLMRRVYDYGRTMTWQKAGQIFRNIRGTEASFTHLCPSLAFHTKINKIC